MLLLITGILLWSLAHLFPSFCPKIRARLIDALGRQPYRGLFSLVIFSSIALMVMGWQSASQGINHEFGLGQKAWAMMNGVEIMRWISAFVMLFVASGLLVSSLITTRLSRQFRHPQLLAAMLWALAHIFLNLELASIVLFGGFLIWAVVQQWAINLREGTWQKPAPVSWRRDVLGLIMATVLMALALIMHGH